MKVSDIIGGENERKVIHLITHLKRKKKANPKLSKTGPMDRLPGDSYGIAGSGDTGSAGGSIV